MNLDKNLASICVNYFVFTNIIISLSKKFSYIENENFEDTFNGNLWNQEVGLLVIFRPEKTKGKFLCRFSR